MEEENKKDKKKNEEETHKVGEYTIKKKNSLGIISFILSLITIGLTFIKIPQVSYITGILSLIFALIALVKRYKKLLPILSILISVFALMWINIKLGYTETILEKLSNNQEKIVRTTGKYSKEETNKMIDVTFNGFKVKKDKNDFDQTEQTVIIKNKSNKTLSGSIYIIARDENRNIIGEDYAHFNYLKKGGFTKVKTFTKINTEDIEKYKTAKYEIKEISLF